MKGRLLFLDIAKAICIVLVVVGHYVPDTSPRWWKELHDVIYYFHMPMFMYASGFIYNSATQKSYGSFLWKKFKRLLVPYFVTSFVVITIKLLMQGVAFVENQVSLMSYIQVFYIPSAGAFLWFVWALWWMFVIIPLFQGKSKHLLLLIFSFCLLLMPFELTSVFCINALKNYLFYFMLGVVASDYRSIWYDKCPIFGVFLFLFLVILKDLFGYYIPTVLLSMIGIFMVLQVSSFLCKYGSASLKNVMINLSLSSYCIYLFHTTFEGFAKAVVVKVPWLSNGASDVGFVVGAFLCIVSGVFVPIVVQKVILERFEWTKFLWGLK